MNKEEQDLQEIKELLLTKNKAEVQYLHNPVTNIFHLNYYRDKYFSINNFDFGITEFKMFLKNLIRKK